MFTISTNTVRDNEAEITVRDKNGVVRDTYHSNPTSHLMFIPTVKQNTASVTSAVFDPALRTIEGTYDHTVHMDIQKASKFFLDKWISIFWISFLSLDKWINFFSSNLVFWIMDKWIRKS